MTIRDIADNIPDNCPLAIHGGVTILCHLCDSGIKASIKWATGCQRSGGNILVSGKWPYKHNLQGNVTSIRSAVTLPKRPSSTRPPRGEATSLQLAPAIGFPQANCSFVKQIVCLCSEDWRNRSRRLSNGRRNYFQDCFGNKKLKPLTVRECRDWSDSERREIGEREQPVGGKGMTPDPPASARAAVREARSWGSSASLAGRPALPPPGSAAGPCPGCAQAPGSPAPSTHQAHPSCSLTRPGMDSTLFLLPPSEVDSAFIPH